MAKRRQHPLLAKIGIGLVILYTVIALAINCWILTTVVIRSGGPTVIEGTVKDADSGAALAGAIVGVRQPQRPGSVEVTAATDASGRYKLTIPSAYGQFQLYVTYGGVPGGISSGPRRKVTGPLKPGESEYQIVQHQVNKVDWEVTVR